MDGLGYEMGVMIMILRSTAFGRLGWMREMIYPLNIPQWLTLRKHGK
jgi:hypothetical protein